MRSIYHALGIMLSKFLSILFHDRALSRWIYFVTHLGKIHLTFALKDRLLMMPNQLFGTVKVSTNEVSFKYNTTKSDDLKFEARRNFSGWEVESRALFCEYAESANCIVDIGAYTGVYTLLALAKNNYLKVVAFEPDRERFFTLMDNLEINGFLDRCSPLNLALSNHHGYRNLYKDAHNSATSMYTLEPGGEPIGKVEVQKLDNLVDSESVDLIKVDIEGYELQALKGGEKILRDSGPAILVEALTLDSEEKLIKYLRSFGYQNPLKLDKRNLFFEKISRI